ncbi:MAG: helix-turn-helix domain-containing protein [Planctomycetes bacterium]|nr:helix-turn-helix domain-containing protein [Planctomycetota bacterium]
MQAVVTAARPMGSREVARNLGLEHTKANRLLGTLCHLGFLSKTPNRKYISGPGIHLLSAQSLNGSRLLATAMPHLRELTDANMIITLAVLWRKDICYLVFAGPGHDPATSIGAHQPCPVHHSILGLALIAEKTDKEVKAILDMYQEPMQPEAKELFLEEIAETRKTGVAKRVRDRNSGGNWNHSFSVTIGEPAVAAIALTGFADDDKVPGLIKRLQEKSELITQQLLAKP